MKLRDVIDVASTVIITGVAVFMALAYIDDSNLVGGGKDYDSARVIAEWEDENESGIRTGPADAAVVITEFIDFQCPFCAELAPTIDSILAEFPDDVAVVFHHFPLDRHEHARSAAIAAECADRQGRFWPMYQALLSRQEEFGTVSWDSFAEDAAVPNLVDFGGCTALPRDSFPRIEYGRSLGERTGITGTPTTWVNGRVIRPSVESIRTLLDNNGEE